MKDLDLRAKSRFDIECGGGSNNNSAHNVLRRVTELLQAASTGSSTEYVAPRLPRPRVLAAPMGTVLFYNFSGAIPCRRRPDIDTARGFAEVHRPASDAGSGQGEGDP